MPNALYYGDNLDVLRDSIASESVDLVYLDPPFNSQATYGVLFSNPTGVQSQAQIEAFEDTWHWNQSSERAFDEMMRCGNTNAADLMRAIRGFLGENDLMAYLAMMAIRLVELHRVLRKTGSIYLHCDPTASHYLKLVLDSIFGKENFHNEISWKRSGRRSSISKIFRRAHDSVFFYSKSENYNFNLLYKQHDKTLIDKYSGSDDGGAFRLVPIMASGKRGGETGKPWRGFDPNTRGKAGMHWITTHDKLEAYVAQGLVVFPKKESGVPQLRYYLKQNPGVPLSDFWDDIDLINSMGGEALGYATQKPVALLERILEASSGPNSVILDPFCGCGTTIHAAQKLGRQWIGIDVTHLAISLIERRLKDAFPGIAFAVHGTPSDLDGARDLAARDKYQFQWWAVSLIEAQPYGGKKKGADGGIDGLIYFRSDAKTTERAIVSVKGGGVSVPMVRDLKGVLDREKAPIGVFLTLEPPTRPMEKEAASAGFYTLGERQYPRLQIITIEDALRGKMPSIPLVDTGAAFKRAARENATTQGKMEF